MTSDDALDCHHHQVWIRRSKEGRGGRWRFSEGKSGSFMYYTHDRRLIVKTIDSSEAAILTAHAPEYTEYLRAQPGSYLTKFYGLYSISMYNTTMTFVVMGNVFFHAPMRPVAESHLPEMDERYDLKGSWVNRNSSRPKDPHTVKKDNDLNYCLHLSSSRLAELRRQMATDVAFLGNTLHTMDYSLVVGVRRGRFVVNTDGGQTHLTPIDGTEPTGSPNAPHAPFAAAPSFTLFPIVREGSGGSSGSGVSPRASCSLAGAVLGTVSPLFTSSQPRGSSGGAALDAAPDAAPAAACQYRPESPSRPYSHSVEYAIIVEGPQSYYLGLVDVLQTWSLRKQLEHFCKVWLPPWHDGQGISAVPPSAYADRFLKRVVYDVFDAPLTHQDEQRLLGLGASPSPTSSLSLSQSAAAAASGVTMAAAVAATVAVPTTRLPSAGNAGAHGNAGTHAAPPAASGPVESERSLLACLHSTLAASGPVESERSTTPFLDQVEVAQ